MSESDEKKLNTEGGRNKAGAGKRAYYIFLFFWCATLVTVVGVLLGRFKRFLEDYEAECVAAYEASLPESVTSEVVDLMSGQNAEALLRLVGDKPELSGYEADEDIYLYMRNEMQKGPISVREETKTEDEPRVFDFLAGDSMIARGEYSKEDLPEGEKIPKWDLVSFAFYTDAAFERVITAPENVTVYVNGVELDKADGICDESIPAAQRFFDGFAEVPHMETYTVSGLYYDPDISAVSEEGTPLTVHFDEGSGKCTVDYPDDCPSREEIEEITAKAVKAYATFVSGDLSMQELRPYFTPNNIYLYYMEHAELRWFTRHRDSSIKNAEVLKFISYTPDACFCEVMVEQHLTMQWGSSEPEVIMTDGRFYLVKQNGEWKVCSMEF